MASLINQIYEVCIPHTLRDSFDYSAGGVKAGVGCRVWVHFRHQKRIGVIVAEKKSSNYIDKLKSIESVVDDKPLISKDLLSLCRWVSQYYQSPLSEVLSLAIPKRFRTGQKMTLPYTETYQLTCDAKKAHQLIQKKAIKQQELIDLLDSSRLPLNKKQILKQGFSTVQLNALKKHGLISVCKNLNWPMQKAENQKPPLSLNEEQNKAVEEISKRIDQYHCVLLHGITGSGKTEVYLQVIHKILSQGKQVLYLVPEIGLTPQLRTRFKERITHPVAVIHSGLSETERQLTWNMASEGRVKLIVGTRAAVFTPMPELGLIVIDEEHDSSLKQMDGVRYSARDTALMRAHLANIPIILGSATPSLESLQNCKTGKYHYLQLKQRALTNTPLLYHLVDIRNLPLKQGFAQKSLNVIQKHLSNGNQVLVFINRRGFAPVLLCHQCGWMADCMACDAHLTLHRNKGRLICHHCGLTQKIPHSCSFCKSSELIPIGMGTQRVHDFLQNYFPETEVLRIDRDEVRQKQAFDTHLQLITKGEVQLIVGTQMLAKGHHFPRLSLVVILDTDTGFYNQDFRAIERLGQLLIQVAGRAGRTSDPGEVLIQTHLPQHPLLNSLVQKGYHHFSEQLLEAREKGKWPPFSFLAVLRAQSKNAERLLDFLHNTKERIKNNNITVLGPAPAPLAFKANQHRMQLLIKSSSRPVLRSMLTDLRQWMEEPKNTQGIRWNLDVDPQDLS